MARRTVVMLTDDLDGSDATETVRFGLDGRDYEVDLSKKNAKSLSYSAIREGSIRLHASNGGVDV